MYPRRSNSASCMAGVVADTPGLVRPAATRLARHASGVPARCVEAADRVYRSGPSLAWIVAQCPMDQARREADSSRCLDEPTTRFFGRSAP
jgi:hypothetical protein